MANPLARKFLTYLQHERNFSEHTIRSYTADLAQFVGFLASGAESSEAIDDELIERCRTFDIHPSGPLWGAGEIMTSGETVALEDMETDVDSTY